MRTEYNIEELNPRENPYAFKPYVPGEKYKEYTAKIRASLDTKTVADLLAELQEEIDASLAKGEEIDLDIFYAYMDVLDEIDPLEDVSIEPKAIFEKVLAEHPELGPDASR